MSISPHIIPYLSDEFLDNYEVLKAQCEYLDREVILEREVMRQLIWSFRKVSSLLFKEGTQ